MGYEIDLNTHNLSCIQFGSTRSGSQRPRSKRSSYATCVQKTHVPNLERVFIFVLIWDLFTLRRIYG